MHGLDSTIAYYNTNAKQYSERTISTDMSDRYERFLKHVPQGGRVLDVGFGSGRDLKAFQRRGYMAEGIDASEGLCQLAEEQGLPVCCITIQDWCEEQRDVPYDGIWACASILHLSETDIFRFFQCIKSALKKDGVLFVSVKNGIDTGLDEEGRFFTNFTEDMLFKVSEDNPNLKLIERWESGDGLGRKGFVWWNMLFRNERK